MSDVALREPATASGVTSYLLVRALLVIEVLIVFGHVTICSSTTFV